MFRRYLPFLASLLVQPAWADFTLTVLHTNDLHAHAEPVKVKNVELGGYARQATLIKKLRAENTSTILLNGGDTFQGTLFFNTYQGLADLAFMNQVGYQAMAVGNHEFDRGPAVFANFVRGATFPVLAANLDVSEDKDLKDLVKPWAIVNVAGEKIGVVGAVTPDLPSISSPGETVKMKDLRSSLQAAIDELTAQKIDKIIVLSHCGYGLEKDMAKFLRNVDMVVGGHSHTFLGDTKLPDDRKGAGPYPTLVKNASGQNALVVQSWEWGKVFGKVDVTFDDLGVVKSWSNDQPIAVTADIPEDPTVASLISALKKPIEDLMNKEVGRTETELPRSGPGKQGVLADIITDAMLDATKAMGSTVALMNSGGIRSALNAGVISYGDAISVQPFNNTLVVLDLTGAELEETLSSGVLFVSQGSSFRLSNGKATEILISGQKLEPSKTYRCTFNSFVANGGDGLTVVKNATGKRTDTGLLDIDALIEYLKKNSPLKKQAEGRIK